MNLNHKISISLIFGFVTAMLLGVFLGGEHPLMLEMDRIGKSALLPTVGMVLFYFALILTLLSSKLSKTVSSVVIKSIFGKLLTIGYLLMLSSVGFTLGILGLANRI